MSLKETIFSMMLEALELGEAVEVRHDRYMRSHGKKARDSGGSSSWMFTHKDKGDVNVNDKEEVHTAQGNYTKAKKSAQDWAKKHGHHTVYVMEEVQLDEISKKTLGSYIKKAASDIGYAAAADDTNKELKRHKGIAKAANKLTKEEVEQIDEISDEKKKEYIRAVADKGGILRKPRPGSLKGFDRKKDDALVKAFKGGSMQDYANLHNKSETRAGIALKALNSLKKEEVELDEVSDQKLDTYRQKAFADQPAGDDGSDKYRKRKFGRDLAFAKQTGRAKVLATKEEVDLEESWSKGASSANRSDAVAAAKHQAEADRLRKAANKLGKDNPQHNELMGDHHKAMAKSVKHSFHSGAYPSMKIAKDDHDRHMDQAKRYNSAVTENYELDEAKTDMYHKHMLKALGKTRLPKDHNYTSAIANNGDFVVHNAGRVIGRIPKGEHDLK